MDSRYLEGCELLLEPLVGPQAPSSPPGWVWTFSRLVKITALILTVARPPQAGGGGSPGAFSTRLSFSSDAGLGFRRNWDMFGDKGSGLEIRHAGSGHGFEAHGVLAGSDALLQVPIIPPAEGHRFQLELLDLVGDAAGLQAAPVGCEAPAPRASDFVLVHCRPDSRPSGGAVADAANHAPTMRLMDDIFNDFKTHVHRAPDVGACFLLMDSILRELAAQGGLGLLATVVLSPLLHGWHLYQHGWELKHSLDLFRRQSADAVAVVGWPSAGVDGRWTWPLRRVRRQYWKLQYTSYPTGSARRLLSGDAAKWCHGGDAVSGSRAYRSDALKALLEHVDPSPGEAWLVNLDLEALRQGLGPRTFLCTHLVLPEDDYLPRATLPSSLATRYDVEAALFAPEAGLQVSCPFSSQPLKELHRRTQELGLLRPWCARKAMVEAWVKLSTWWRSISPQHDIVAIDGTGLALLRGGREPMPWDNDMDFLLASEGDLPETLPPDRPDFAALGFRTDKVLDWKFRSGGLHLELVYVSELPAGPDCAPVEVELDIIFQSATPRAMFPLVATFAGVEVRYSEDIQKILSKKYRAPHKQLRNERDLACRSPGHTACLPNCDGGVPKGALTVACEFPDRFFELNYFE